MVECGVFSPDSQLACTLDVAHQGWHRADGSQWHGNEWGISSYDDTQAAPTPHTSPLTVQWSQDGDGQWYHPRWWQAEQTQAAQAAQVVVPQAVPHPRRTPAAPPPLDYGVVAAVPVGGCNHALHLIATVLTLGLWWPIWMVAALFGRRQMALVDKYGRVVGYQRI